MKNIQIDEHLGGVSCTGDRIRVEYLIRGASNVAEAYDALLNHAPDCYCRAVIERDGCEVTEALGVQDYDGLVVYKR